MMNHNGTKEAADIAAGIVAFGTVAEFLPPIAAAFTILWTATRIYEWARVAMFGKPPRKTD